MIVRIRRAAIGAAAAGIRNQSSSAASSRLTSCPQSILEWRKELASPVASSQRLLGKLHQAFQSPFPPLRERRAWIQAHDVQESLVKIFADGRGRNIKERDMLDLIIVGAQRSLEDARRRAKVQQAMAHEKEEEEGEDERKGTDLSEQEKEASVEEHPDVIAWRNVLTSHHLLYNRLLMATHTLRKPHIEDLNDGLALLQGAPSIRLGHFQQFLRLIVRTMPTSLNQPAKVESFLMTKPNLRQLRLNIALDKEQNEALHSSSHHRQPADIGEYNTLPQDFKQMFEMTWSQMVSVYEVDATCLHIALEMECRLAVWRALSPETDEDAFGPVRAFIRKIRERRTLQTRHLNTILWSALRDIPPDIAPPRMWPSIDDCLELYQYMRANVLWVEMEYERRQQQQQQRYHRHHRHHSGDALDPWRSKPIITTSIMPDKFGVDDFLPVSILPDQDTYELLIRALSWQGGLVKATHLLLEMTQSPIDTEERLKAMTMRRKKESPAEAESDPKEKNEKINVAEEVTYEATIDTFDSFFRGFCNHSTSSDLIHFDEKEPEKSQWAAHESGNEWNMTAFNSLLEAFLALRARDCRRVQDGYRDTRRRRRSSSSSQSGGQAAIRGKTISPSPSISTDDDRRWLRTEADIDENDDAPHHLEDLCQSIVSLELPVNEYREYSCKAPSTQQLFYLLTALRRTSNDNAQWVLYQWRRIVDKFSLSEFDVGKVNHEGWHGWALDPRLRRIIAHLEQQVDEQRKGEDEEQGDQDVG